MNILGIETSCDETAAAVVAETGVAERPWQIRSNIVASQVAIHREWGGVVPELASRQHIRDICGVVTRALADAQVGFDDLNAIAVTQGPGLVGSLLVGVAFGKSLALSLGLPLVPVHHLAGHIESLVLEHGEIPLPAVVLVVSGGHTNLYLVPTPGTYRLLGRTRDDAAGEAYDKVAKLLGLGYPGGPIVDRLAREGRDDAIDFPVARMTHADRNAPTLKGDLDFSFSGLKTAVVRFVRENSGGLSASTVADVCASFQRSVIEALLDRTFEAAWRHDARSVGIAGGVSANSRLRRDATTRGQRAGLPVFVPSLALSTDNAAMIAASGLRQYRAGVTAGWELNADANLGI
ncbi:MAG TPA: tRNA (adenosine(37)-N6)-threonylcarbamoyltransferase complex transferase subunit TsaD [Vicinamibacterales bacterium]